MKKKTAPTVWASLVSELPIKRLLMFTVSAIVLVVGLILAGSAYWQHQQTAFQNLPRLMAALQAFSSDQARKGSQVPKEVSLPELMQGGYLSAEDVRAFDGMEVVFRTHMDLTQPQSLIARARTQDGIYICLLADGSVQEFSRERYELERAKLDAVEPPGSGPPSGTTSGAPQIVLPAKH